MGKAGKRNLSFWLLVFTFYFLLFSYAEDTKSVMPSQAKTSVEVRAELAKLQAAAAAKEQPAEEDIVSLAEKVTLDFKEADILKVLKIISLKSGVNIVTTPEVMGNVSIRMVDVPWDMALDVLLKTYGFGYSRQGNVILVTKLENMSRIQEQEPLQTEIFMLKFLDAQDAQKIIVPLLSPRGKISVLFARGQKGWQFGTFKIGPAATESSAQLKREQDPIAVETLSMEKTATGEITTRKAEYEPAIKSKTLVITDTAASLDRVRNLILPQVDRKPKQVLIEARIMEVDRDKLRDIGVDWGTGSSGASGYKTAPGDNKVDGKGKETLAGRSLFSEFAPSIFGPKEGSSFTGSYPYSAGLELIFKKLTGYQFEVIIHALEEDVHTNTLSAPRILTLDNQEASILVGYHTPILKSELTAGTVTEGSKLTQTLDYYQEIGIRLNVVPQVNQDGYINMIIHPSITSSSTNVSATSFVGNSSTTTNYPIIDVRETQTQVLIKDEETIVIGGLLKDIKAKEKIGIPFLSKIPVLGLLFFRDTYDIVKMDLLIFITARILKDNEITAQELARLERSMAASNTVEIKRDLKAKKNIYKK